MAQQVITLPGSTLQIVETPAPVVQIVNTSPASGSGITSLGGQTGQVQTFSDVDDTNVTLAIASASNNHAFTLGWTGQLALARGGTGAADAAGARTNLGLGALAVLNTVGTSQIDDNNVTFAKLPDLGASKLIGRTNAGAGDPQEITLGAGLSMVGQTLSATGGTGDVVGPAAATDNALARFDGITGKLIQNSNATLTDVGDLTITGTIGASNLSGTNTGNVTVAGESYLTLVGQAITANPVNLGGTNVTGDLPFSKIQQIATARVLGRTTAAAGDIEELAAGAGISIAGGQIASTITQYDNELAQDAVGTILVDTATIDATYDDITPQITFDVKDNSITFAKFQDITDARLLGRSAGLAGDMQELTVAAPLTLVGGVLDFDETAALGNNARVTIRKNSGADVGTRRRINVIEGANITLTVTDDGAGEEVDITIAAAGGGGTPGGADTQLQYNNGGAFGGISLSNWDDINNDLTLGSYSGTGEFVTILSSNAAATALKIDSAAGTGAYVLTGASGTSFKSETTGGKAFTGLSNDGGTANAVELVSLTHNSTGTPAANFGSRIAFYGESTTTADTPMANIDACWLVPTHASSRAYLAFQTRAAGSVSNTFTMFQTTSPQTCYVLSGAGSASQGFVYGANAFVCFDAPDGGTSGGNSRGTLSFDAQLGRDNAADVAAGFGSVCLGYSNRSAHDYTLTTGRHAYSDRYGSRAHAAGAFSSATPGGAQEFMCVWRRQTTDATANVELFLDGSGVRNTLVNNSTLAFEIHVLARRTNGDVENAHYKFEGAIKRDANAASTAIVGAVTKTVIAEDTAAWDAQVTADTTNGSIKVDVTGEALKNINWVATGYFAETRE